MPDPSRHRRFLPDCEEVHHLTMKGMDRPLSVVERVRVRSHLMICDACTRFSAQMRLMRSAMRMFGQDGQDGEGPGSPR